MAMNVSIRVYGLGLLDEELSGAIAPMLQLPPEELTRLLLALSRKELLERFAG